MKYLFGPVISRRLGRSLGVDLLPGGICSLNCIYCEVGPKSRLTCARGEYEPTADILAEIDLFLARGGGRDVDIFTITANGEPTLHSGLGQVIGKIKSAGFPVAVITNSTLLARPDVQDELRQVDVLMPSLDALRGPAFTKVNRPAGCVDMEAAVRGLADFSRRFSGKIWLEILLVEGVNDGPGELAVLIATAKTIRLDRVQLNTVARPPLEAWARPVSAASLRDFAARLEADLDAHVRVEILVDVAGPSVQKASRAGATDRAEMLNKVERMLLRRPCTVDDVAATLMVDSEQARGLLEHLLASDRIRKKEHGNKVFFQPR